MGVVGYKLFQSFISFIKLWKSYKDFIKLWKSSL